MKVVVDHDVCCLYAQCAGVAPGLFWLDAERIAYVENPEEEQRALVEEAVLECPSGAITVIETPRVLPD